MNPNRLHEITDRYRKLRVAVVGDFCLDRYLEIDPARIETSIETGLAVHNVMHVRAQPGAAGTILNNLVALGIGRISAVGFCGEDGEGYELLRALRAMPGVDLSHFVQTPLRRTFTYCFRGLSQLRWRRSARNATRSSSWIRSGLPTPACSPASFSKSCAGSIARSRSSPTAGAACAATRLVFLK
jgi:hypothetical protein